MADTAVAITAGTGTNIDTRTEATNGNHRQVVVLGDPATNAGVAPVDATNGLAVQVIPALPAGTNNIGDVDVLTVPTDPFGANADAASATGSVSAKLRAIATALGTTALDLGSGTGGTRTIRTMIDSSQLDPTVAHDAADSGAPYKQGYKATTSLAGLTLVANADRTDGFAGIDGVQIVRPHCNLEDLISGVAAITDGSSTSVIASAGAGVKNYVTTAIIANTSATAVTVDLRDGAAGTVKATLPVPANTSGVVCNLPVPLGFSAATAVCADPSAAASTVTVTLIGFKSKV
jgi:hypothetical protein